MRLSVVEREPGRDTEAVSSEAARTKRKPPSKQVKFNPGVQTLYKQQHNTW